MFQLFGYFVLIAINVNYINADCGYYQTEGTTIFPTDTCSLRYTKSDVDYSQGYYCTAVLGRVQLRQWQNSNCQGTDFTVIGTDKCDESTCNCNGVPEDCKSTHTIYFSPNKAQCNISSINGFSSYNMTLVTDLCVNYTRTTCGDFNKIYFDKYASSTCSSGFKSKSGSMDSSCWNTDCNKPTSSPTSSPSSSSNLLNISMSSYIIIGIVIIMSFGTICTICCMIKKYRKKQKCINNVNDNLLDINNDIINEGINEHFVENNGGEIEINDNIKNIKYHHMDPDIAKPYNINDDDDNDDIDINYDDLNNDDEGIEGDEGDDGI